MTFKPRTETGKEQQQAVGEFLQPVGEALKSTEDFLGNSVLEVTGSPEIAAIAHSLPTAVLTLLGVKGLKSTKLSKSKLSTNVSEAITQAAPDIQKLKVAASELYKQLDNSGVSVKPEVYDRFVSKLTSKLAKENIDPVLHPKSAQVLKILNDKAGTPKTFSELNNMRQIVGEAASAIDPSDARLGKIMLNTLDDGIEQLATAEGGKFKSDRAIWRKTKKSQDINDMIANATQQASGLENGLRIGARRILKSKKKSRGFTKSELAALRQVSEGTTTANIAKFLGKFGISEGQATSMLGASIGIGGGGALGAAFGGSLGAGIGAVAVPLFGQLANKTA